MANYALQTDGSQNYISLGTLGNLGSNLGSGFYCRFIINTSSTSGGLFGYGAVGSQNTRIAFNYNYSMTTVTNHGLSVMIRGTDGNFLCGGNSAPTINFNDGSNHIIEVNITPSTNTIAISIDGVDQTITYIYRQSPATWANLSANPFLIGAEQYGGVKQNYFACTVDDFRIGTSSGALYGLYAMNEGSGTTVADTSGGSHNGTLGKGAGSYPAWVAGLSTLPIVTSSYATSITSTTADLNGSLVSDGNDTISAQGFCWGTSANPTILNNIAAATPGTLGDYSAGITGLTDQVVYHFRAYATNSAGTTYGADQVFLAGALAPTVTNSAATSVVRTSAVGNGEVVSDGGTIIIQRGFVLGTSVDPTISDTKYVVAGTTGIYTGSLLGLTANTSYHYRAFATNGVDTSYGTDQSFTTNPNGVATLTSAAPLKVTPRLVKGYGVITDGGGTTITEQGLVLSTTLNPTTSDTKFIIPVTATTYEGYMKDLNSSSIYHYRAYAINSSGTGYSEDESFTTDTATVPVIYSYMATALAATQANGNGNIISDGGSSIIERGFVVSTNANPTISDTKFVVAGTTGIYTGVMTLTQGTQYHYRAYATNSIGTGYGLDMTFYTLNATGRNWAQVDDYFGITVGSDINNGGTQTTDGLQDDVDFIADAKVKNIRASLMSYQYIGGANAGSYGAQQMAILKTMMQMYIVKGITVQAIPQVGGSWSPTSIYNDGFKMFLADQAAWAQANGITRLQLDNELEIRTAGGVTHTQVYDWLQSLIPIARAAGFTGVITYSTFYDVADKWRTSGIGSFDDLGMDHYGSNDSSLTNDKLTKSFFGSAAYLSEWSVNNSGIIWDFNLQDPLWVRNQLMRRWSQIKLIFPNHVNYYYVWKNANDGPKDALAVRMLTTAEIKRLFWYALTNQRSPIIW